MTEDDISILAESVELTVADDEGITLTVAEESITLTVEGDEMATWALDLVRGQHANPPLTFKTNTGADYDLTNATIYWVVKRREKDSVALIEKDSTDATEIDIQAPATDGIAILHIVPSDTNDLEPGTLVHDIWIKDGANEYHPVIDASPLTLKWGVKRTS
jgi:hypothetical protein